MGAPQRVAAAVQALQWILKGKKNEVKKAQAELAVVEADERAETAQLDALKKQHAAELADAKMKWEALPAEKMTAQENIDGLVRRVEHALMSVLPPLPAQVNAPSLENDNLLNSAAAPSSKGDARK